jgi:glycerate kinase
MKALACPASLKGVLTAVEAASYLAAGFRSAGVDVEELPIADGGEGTLEVLARALPGEWRTARVSDSLLRPVEARWLLLEDGRAVVESAEAIGISLLAEEERDPLRASSRGLGELIAAALEASPRELVIGLGGSATVDGGAGMLEVLSELPVPTTVACDVRSPLLDAVHVFAAQKGATPDELPVLEERLRGLPDVPGAGAAGGLGGALATLGAILVPGAELVLDAIGFDPRGFDLVVTGEGAVDDTTFAGKAPGEVRRRCAAAGVRCHLFSARDDLSGDPNRAVEDLFALGELLGHQFA